MDDGVEHPFRHLDRIEPGLQLALAVHLGVGHNRSCLQVSLLEAIDDDWNSCPKHVESNRDVTLEEGHPRVAVVETEEKQSHDKSAVLVKGVENNNGDAFVIMAPVDEEKTFEESELGDGVVRSAHSLHALVSRYSDANVCSLNHGHVVGPVPNGQRHGCRLHPVLNESHDDRLLIRRHATRNNSLAHLAKGEEEVLKILIRLDETQRPPVYDEGEVFCLHADVVLVLLKRTLQLLSHHVFAVSVDNGDVHFICEELTGETNVDSRLLLISREHPYLEPTAGEGGNGFRYPDLKLVFDGRGADYFEVGF
mmetsp:Transcript_15901/g.37946  ORF Transcript_15901/g.37946 Transcript_15901/m.37946 type:complete len:309 (+) Transcript_15901:836-1762(+)